ncbi:PREDICTED: transmembrane protein 225 isoform X1 [Chinchilla lanigera]|uniref:Transmembrane protein 225 n=1 Tax=Chinchilla lanigera TaxID=34839 RepID=A0A8C2VTG1_CHILA|nr:PREDICTED: transmembrane protein 225 isoform X1 [Chinchilla lanigera]
MSKRNIQTTNLLFSSWAVVSLIIGVFMKEWVELVPKIKKVKISHSPWMTCCTTIWPEDSLKVVRIMMVLVLCLSFFLNLILGMQYTYVIPQNRYIQLIIAFSCFLTGCLLLGTLTLYHHKLNQGQGLYFSSFKITWVPFTAYLTAVFFITCGFLCLLQCKQPIHSCTCQKIHSSTEQCIDKQLCGQSIQVISLPESTAMPRGIVRLSSQQSKEDSANKEHLQKRHVTWAL